MDGFNFLTLLPLPIWLAMILFPKTRFTQRVVLSYWPHIALGGVYLVLLVTALVTGDLDLSFSVSSLRESFSRTWLFLAGWTHYLALNLFAGVWIFRDAKYWGIRPGVYLALTLLFGPVGLAGYLLVRERRNKTDPVRTLN